MEDDDDFLYGEPSGPQRLKAEPDPTSRSNVQAFNGHTSQPELKSTPSLVSETKDHPGKEEDDEEDEEEVDLGEDSDEDEIEIIMEPVARSLDFRNQNRPSTSRAATTGAPPTQPRASAPQPSLTTEYNPIQRGGPLQPTSSSSSVTTQAQPQQESTPTPSVPSASAPTPQPPSQPTREQTSAVSDDGVDTSTLPPAEAPPSAPVIDPNATGVFDGRSILEVDLNALADKPWRRPGSDISDWFNYGFDEISWEVYCYRRRDVGDLAAVLKTNVINFAAMPEEQLTALPPEVRTMVMTGASAMMGNAGANPGMMGPGMMMDMSGMMGPMGMGMNGDMGMGGPMMQSMMADGTQGQQGVGIVPGNGTPEQVGTGVGMMQDGFNPNGMNMGMGNEYGMQEQGPMVQQMYPVMETQNVPSVPSARGTQIPFRGSRGAPGLGGRGRGFAGRGRGRGFDAPPPVPVRPASPLPPGVPTGPRNQNKYKDRDGNAPAVDGLDYGGGKDAMGRRTPSEQPEERDRLSSRKRRSSPGLDDIRGSKRR